MRGVCGPGPGAGDIAVLRTGGTSVGTAPEPPRPRLSRTRGRTPTVTVHPRAPSRELRRTMPTKGSAKHHPHDDAPDPADAFRKLAELPAGQQRDTLREQVVEAWLPMAERLAGRFRSRGESFEDLRQVAALGLVKAVDRYNP